MELILTSVFPKWRERISLNRESRLFPLLTRRIRQIDNSRAVMVPINTLKQLPNNSKISSERPRLDESWCVILASIHQRNNKRNSLSSNDGWRCDKGAEFMILAPYTGITSADFQTGGTYP